MKNINLNEDLEKVIAELKQVCSSNKLQGYFMVLDFGDSKTLCRYDSSHYPQLLGLVQLMNTDLQMAMLESLQAFQSQSDGVLSTDPAAQVSGSQSLSKKTKKPTLQ